MIKVFYFSLIIALAGCANLKGSSKSGMDVCDANLPEATSLNDIKVHAYTDRHGSYFTIDACPERALSADFSSSDLYEPQHANLLKEMRIRGYQERTPVKMKISGTYSRSRSMEGRATIVVDKILGYELK